MQAGGGGGGDLQPGANADRLGGTEAAMFLFKESAADRCNYDHRGRQ